MKSPPSNRSLGVLSLLLALPLVGCKKPPPTDAPQPASTASTTAATSASAASTVGKKKPVRSTGSALARSVSGDVLYLADEDGKTVRRVAIPLADDKAPTELAVPGPPSQVIARDGEILVTVRDPGMLLILTDDTGKPGIENGGLHQVATVKLPADAWGMALSPDESTLVVTSAWTHTVSVVDLAKREVVAKLDVSREPRGVVVSPDGKKAWVTHLMGTAVTKIELNGAASTATPVALPAGTARAARHSEPSASLAYAPLISEDGNRLLVPRHALGTVSPNPKLPTGSWGGGGGFAWWGTATVDVLLLKSETPLMPARASAPMTGLWGGPQGLPAQQPSAEDGALPETAVANFLQPRDAIWRKTRGSILVVSEGTDALIEVDPLALDPALGIASRYPVGKGYLADNKTKEPTAEIGAAPQAVALSEDEMSAYVWARGGREIVHVPLTAATLGGESNPYNSPPKDVKLVAFPETLSKQAAQGRKLFYDGDDRVMSGGLACSGCHPDGRDDGFVWRETTQKAAANQKEPSNPCFVGSPAALFETENDGIAKQTPMLAGRVTSPGPFGWHAQSKDMEARLMEGFNLHRWQGQKGEPTAYEKAFRLAQLKAYLREGLRPPPHDDSPFTPEEERGRTIFESEDAQCKTCHPAAGEYTTRAPVPLRTPLPTRNGFATEENALFRVPSLLFVGGTAPYYHDGSAKTLTELIEKNGNRMGDTSKLSADDRAALVAFLRRL